MSDARSRERSGRRASDSEGCSHGSMPSFIYQQILYSLKSMSNDVRRSFNKLRCLVNKRNYHTSPELRYFSLTHQEVTESLLFVVKIVQKTSFVDEVRLLQRRQPLPSSNRIASRTPYLDFSVKLRVGGQIQHALVATDRKTPMLLPRHHRLVTLLIRAKNHLQR
ncbi:unnamed protein product [Allacma fusca]|uniref:Uncharacterized protein n=1 Tax=Allacma fusca TaxID=39272 RepID=A0A8J2NUX8_9HEXA|nr:unnamed protein product [Allacma fusca]